MLPPKEQSLRQQLRDVVLLEADWHSANAERLDKWAADFHDHAFGKVLRVAANGSRARATILHGALIATDPARTLAL